MIKYLAFSVGDGNSITNVALPGQPGKILNDPNVVAHFFLTFFSTLLFIAVILAFGFIVFFGYRYMVSQGDKKEIETARTALLNSIVGLLIVFMSFFVVNLLGYFFLGKFTILNLTF